MWSDVGYWRNKGGMNVISCGLLAIQGRNACDQLWVTGDTGEEWMWSAVGYPTADHLHSFPVSSVTDSWSHSFLPCIASNQQLITCIPLLVADVIYIFATLKLETYISCGLLAIRGRNECDQLWVTDDTGEEWMWSAVGSHSFLPCIASNPQLITFIPPLCRQ
jgi:hypothetical protein